MGRRKKKKPGELQLLDSTEQDHIIDGFLASLQSIDSTVSDEHVVSSDASPGLILHMQDAPCAKDSPTLTSPDAASDEHQHMQQAPCAVVDSPAVTSLGNAVSDEHGVEGDATHMQYAPCAPKDSPPKTSPGNVASDEHVFDVFEALLEDGSPHDGMPSTAVVYDLASDDTPAQFDHGSDALATDKQYQDDVHTQLVARPGMPHRPAWSDVLDDDGNSNFGFDIGVATVSELPSIGHAGYLDYGTQCGPLQSAAYPLPVLPFTPPDEGEAGSECRSVARPLGHDNSEGACGLDGAHEASADALDESVRCALDSSDTIGYGEGPQSDIHVNATSPRGTRSPGTCPGGGDELGIDVVGDGFSHMQDAPCAAVDTVTSPAKTSLDIAGSDEQDVAKDSLAQFSFGIEASEEHDDDTEELPDARGIHEFLVGKSAASSDYHRIVKSVLPDVYGDDLALFGSPCGSTHFGSLGFDTRLDDNDLDADDGLPSFGMRSEELSHMQYAPCAKDSLSSSVTDFGMRSVELSHMQYAPCAKDPLSSSVPVNFGSDEHGMHMQQAPCAKDSPAMTSPGNVASDEHEHVQPAPCADKDSAAKTSVGSIASDEHVVDSRMQHAPCATKDSPAVTAPDVKASDKHVRFEGDATQQHASCVHKPLSALESLANLERFGHSLDQSPLKDLMLDFFPKHRAQLEKSAALGKDAAALGKAAASRGARSQDEGHD